MNFNTYTGLCNHHYKQDSENWYDPAPSWHYLCPQFAENCPVRLVYAAAKYDSLIQQFVV